MKVLAIIALALAVVNAAPRASVEDNSVDEDVEFIDLSQYGASIFMEPSNRTGNLVASYDPDTDDRNPEELGEYLEGDMLMPPSLARNGLIATASHWPGGIVPFEISGYFDANAMDSIERAINEYHRRTCIRFRPRTYERDYITFTSEQTGCWSSVGRIGGRQPVNLQVPGCTVKVGTIIHEMMHALGFFHEQNRSDRDDFVYINWQNVRPGTQVNFDKQSSITTTTYNVAYDYGSVMHYSSSAFSRNGQPTITPKLNRKNDKEMGQREELSHLDITKISRMYECNRRPQFGFGLGSIASGIFSATQSGNHLAARPKPPTNSAGNSGFSSGSNSGAASAFAGREDFGQWNPFRDIFNTYTSPRFWQRFIGSWLSQQPQPRQQTYNDYPYPYSFGQNLGQDYYYG